MCTRDIARYGVLQQCRKNKCGIFIPAYDIPRPVNKLRIRAIKRVLHKCRDENALIQFRGRKDSLVKHMGYRIELGAIEHVIINELGLVKYCCAVYQFDKKEIILYNEKAEEISGAEFRKMLMKKFPAYMIPAVYIRMDLLPRNTNGKIDRLLLKNKINEVNGDGKDSFDAGGNSSGA